MTICIAAFAATFPPVTLQRDDQLAERCIVACFDSMVASYEFGSESEHKFYPINDQLSVLVAGLPGRARELVWIYRDLLSNVVFDTSNFLDKIREGVAVLRAKLANEYTQKALSVSFDEFLANGEVWFGREIANRHLADVAALSLDVEMLFVGFIEDLPVIGKLSFGEASLVTNFAAIGTGSNASLASLHSRAIDIRQSERVVAYATYEAKKLSENSPFVGKETRMYILRRPIGGDSQMRISVIVEPGQKILDRHFRKFGPKPLRKRDLQDTDIPMSTGYSPKLKTKVNPSSQDDGTGN